MATLTTLAVLAVAVGCGKGGGTPAGGAPSPSPTAASPSDTTAPGGSATDTSTNTAASPPADAPNSDASLTSGTSAEPGSAEPAPTGPVADVIKKALSHYEAGELSEAVSTVQAGLEAHPDDRQLSFMLAQVQQGAAIQTLQTKNETAAGPLFIAGAIVARELYKKFQPLNEQEQSLVAQSLYNGACFKAKENQLAEAQTFLEESVTAGFDDLNLLDTDADLNSLREQPAYQPWRKKIEPGLNASRTKKVKLRLDGFESFPFDFQLADVDDKPRQLADYKGKVLVVDFWGTWCPPCRMEIPHFIELRKKYEKQGFEVVGINYEDGSPEEVKKLIKDFMKENGMTYTCVVGDEATRDRVPNFEGFPTTLFIDRAGKVRFKEVGYKPLAELEAIVKVLLEEMAPEAAAEAGPATGAATGAGGE
jgi:thiol-disulfide isomerase/thioredoxin